MTADLQVRDPGTRGGHRYAFVLSGGANLGSEQAGMLEALLEAGIRPDVLVGTSIGAANAAYLAAEPSLPRARRLSALWRSARSRDVFPINPLRIAKAIASGGALFSPEPFARLVDRELPYTRIEDAAAALRIVTTDFESGNEVVLATGSVRDAVLASTALPVIFPPHEFEGRMYLDGGLVDHVPIQPAIDAGADTIYVLSVGFPCPPPSDHRSARAVLLHSLGILLSQRVRADEAHLPDHNPAIRIITLPPVCTQIGLRDFSRSGELIARARTQTARFLAGLPQPVCDCALHQNPNIELDGRRGSVRGLKEATVKKKTAILASTMALGLVLAACSSGAGGTPVAAGEHDVGAKASADTPKASELREGLRKFWEDHITWTRLFIVSAAEGLKDTDATAQRLLRNQDDIGNAIKPFYGEEAGAALTKLLREHILTAADLLGAAKAGDNAKVAKIKATWYRNGDEISAFLSKANPDNWPLQAVKSHMKIHLDLTLEEAVARLEGRYADDIAAYDKIHDAILDLSDTLAAGIVAQFPDRFAA